MSRGTEAPISAEPVRTTTTQRTRCQLTPRRADPACWRSAEGRTTCLASGAGSSVRAGATADTLLPVFRGGGGVGRFLRGAFPGAAGEAPARGGRGASVRGPEASRSARVRITVAARPPLWSSPAAVAERRAASTARYSAGVGRSLGAADASTASRAPGPACRTGLVGRGRANSLRSCSKRAHIGHSSAASRANS